MNIAAKRFNGFGKALSVYFHTKRNSVIAALVTAVPIPPFSVVCNKKAVVNIATVAVTAFLYAEAFCSFKKFYHIYISCTFYLLFCNVVTWFRFRITHKKLLKKESNDFLFFGGCRCLLFLSSIQYHCLLNSSAVSRLIISIFRRRMRNACVIITANKIVIRTLIVKPTYCVFVIVRENQSRFFRL